MRSVLLVLLLLLSPLLMTCGGDGPTEVPDPPIPGVVTLRLVGNGLVGGILFEVEGPVGEVTPVAGVTIQSSLVGATRRVLAYGNISSGPVVQVAMEDVRLSREVTVRLLQLADVQTFEQISVGIWSLIVTR